MDDTQWRLVKLETRDAFMNMALDEAVSESVASGESMPTIRFYKWKPSAVSIGYFQSLKEEVDDNFAKEIGADIVRRRTGGGAVYHDNKGEITYSIIGQEKLFPKDLIESYKLICGWIINSLTLLDIEANFAPINDILVGGKKISGNAQTRRNGILLQHGTILYDLDVETMFRLLKVPKEKISDKMISDVKQRVTRVLDFKQVEEAELAQALVNGFTDGKNVYEEGWTAKELNRARELAQTKYATKEWNYMR
ncbi:MAG: biotin/lipoate A/B protein ligase family protein [Candidatus Diapherotrites archaeon]|nr:biotin/lipoate A/B protein ligase family protein [Candidatus Diapherotrites archaeon]